MLHAINTKILLSGAVILAASAVIVGATFAFFSDTETSTANTLAAGDIDLQIDNESYVTNNLGVLVASPTTSWDLTDLTIQKFFDFTDIKPGDIGEDTISLHVGSNDAWVCAAARITDNSDVDCTEPELTDDPTCTTPGSNQGELSSQVNFSFWADDGDNVLEVGETPFLTGPISGLGQAGQIALVDSAGGPFGPSPIPGGQDRFIGKAWCFGTLTPGAVAQDGIGKTAGPNTNGPLVRGTGFTCDGSLVNNAAQTDRVMADLQFFAVQSRNNGTFTCAQNFTPTWPQVN
jgi:predicted ribosomally synthesized peptide with SipW-like signal peptide